MANIISKIRNFAIIAHVDHGKSTLADRLLEITGILEKGNHEDQYLDRNPISRERGITIKLAPVRMEYHPNKYQIPNTKPQINFKSQILNYQSLDDSDLELAVSNSDYIINLIDTPGHVDFSYEVDRTLACVEGVILLVDATQGIQAQTIANAYKALEKNLVIIPVINKIDLPAADIELTRKQLIEFLGVNKEEILLISAKTGQGVTELLHTIIEKIPSPNLKKSNNQPITDSQSPTTQALIFDCYYDQHRGVIAFVRVFSGRLRTNDQVVLYQAGQTITVQEVGFFSPNLTKKEQLETGEIGYLVTNLKDIHQVKIGDTIVDNNKNSSPLPGYQQVKSMVFASIFPTDNHDYLNLKNSLEKLYLNDSALNYRPIYSKALGPGFRVGFLGLLHAEIVRERLEREFNLSLVLSPPQVEFRFENKQFYEPVVKLLVVTPQSYLGAVMALIDEYRGKFITMDNKSQISLIYEMPMSELISDFYDRLKSVSSGYASLDWELIDYRPADADQLKIVVNDQEVEEFSEIVVKERATEKARYLTKLLREIVPRQQFEVKIQAQYRGKIIASERISPYRKNVLMKHSKLVGAGDFSRKRKLLEKQKAGKKRMKMIGKVEIPKEAFIRLFRRS